MTSRVKERKTEKKLLNEGEGRGGEELMGAQTRSTNHPLVK